MLLHPYMVLTKVGNASEWYVDYWASLFCVYPFDVSFTIWAEEAKPIILVIRYFACLSTLMGLLGQWFYNWHLGRQPIYYLYRTIAAIYKVLFWIRTYQHWTKVLKNEMDTCLIFFFSKKQVTFLIPYHKMSERDEGSWVPKLNNLHYWLY